MFARFRFCLFGCLFGFVDVVFAILMCLFRMALFGEAITITTTMIAITIIIITLTITIITITIYDYYFYFYY